MQGLDELLSSMLNGPEDPPPTSTLAEDEEGDDHHHHHQQQQQQQQQQGQQPQQPQRAADMPAAVDASVVSSGTSSTAAAAPMANSQTQQVMTALNGAAMFDQQQQQHGAQVSAADDAGQGPQQHHQQQQQQQQQEEQPLVKVVLARRTAIPWSDGSVSEPTQQQQQQEHLPAGWQRRSGAVLLQALQERDPRAYQLLISTPPGATFLACTPERLYVRSGRLVASEAVAGTRPRGPPGDLEADFYQGLDLLQSPKDHAEFTLVRDWIRQQLAPLCVELKTGSHDVMSGQTPLVDTACEVIACLDRTAFAIC
jgi:isochorismate synthase EntC